MKKSTEKLKTAPRPDDSVIAAVLEVVSREAATRKGLAEAARAAVPARQVHKANTLGQPKLAEPKPENPVPSAQDYIAELQKLRRSKKTKMKAFFDTVTLYMTVMIMFGLSVLLVPKLVVCLAIVTICFGVVPYLIIGHASFWNKALRPLKLYVKLRPSRAATVQRRLDAFAMQWDAYLDNFPERIVSGLYLPDMSQITNESVSGTASPDTLNLQLNGMTG